MLQAKLRWMGMAIIVLSIGVWFQNCAKNPDLSQSDQEASTSVPSSTSSTPTSTAPTTVTLPTFQGSVSPTYTLNAGQSLTVQAPATGTGLTYQWFQNGDALVSGTNGFVFNTAGYELNIASVVAADSGNYTVKVSNSAGSVSQSFSIVVITPPTITTPPASLYAIDLNNSGNYVVNNNGSLEGTPSQTATFTVQASGTSLTYDWYWIEPSGTKMNLGVTTSTLSFPISTGLNGTYEVVVKNPAGSVSANASFTILDYP